MNNTISLSGWLAVGRPLYIPGRQWGRKCQGEGCYRPMTLKFRNMKTVGRAPRTLAFTHVYLFEKQKNKC